jgi:hypothetical protein
VSGGSYDYVSVWAGDLGELATHRWSLKELSDDLTKDFPGSRAAIDTAVIVAMLYQDPHPSQVLGDVWHAQEWWQSGDWGRERVEAAVDAYEHRERPLIAFMSWVPNGS